MNFGWSGSHSSFERSLSGIASLFRLNRVAALLRRTAPATAMAIPTCSRQSSQSFVSPCVTLLLYCRCFPQKPLSCSAERGSSQDRRGERWARALVWAAAIHPTEWTFGRGHRSHIGDESKNASQREMSTFDDPLVTTTDNGPDNGRANLGSELWLTQQLDGGRRCFTVDDWSEWSRMLASANCLTPFASAKFRNGTPLALTTVSDKRALPRRKTRKELVKIELIVCWGRNDGELVRHSVIYVVALIERPPTYTLQTLTLFLLLIEFCLIR